MFHAERLTPCKTAARRRIGWQTETGQHRREAWRDRRARMVGSRAQPFLDVRPMLSRGLHSTVPPPFVESKYRPAMCLAWEASETHPNSTGLGRFPVVPTPAKRGGNRPIGCMCPVSRFIYRTHGIGTHNVCASADLTYLRNGPTYFPPERV